MWKGQTFCNVMLLMPHWTKTTEELLKHKAYFSNQYKQFTVYTQTKPSCLIILCIHMITYRLLGTVYILKVYIHIAFILSAKLHRPTQTKRKFTTFYHL